MEDYVEFFGGVDSIDVSDLMKPALVIGGRKKKSASTVKLFSKKSIPIKRKIRHSNPVDDTLSITGSGEDQVCPTFAELENKRIAGEEDRALQEISALVDGAKLFGGFSSDEEDISLVGIDTRAEYDLTALDSDESVGMAGQSLLDIDSAD